MFNLNDFRVRDLDEIVIHDYKRGEPFDIQKADKSNYFHFSKTCRGHVYFNKEKTQMDVTFGNSLIDHVELSYGENFPIPIDAVDLNSLFENVSMLDFHVTDKKLFRNKEEYLSIAHKLMSNIEKITEGKSAIATVKEIIGPDNYEKYMKKADKHYQREQQETIDSQTPEPF